MPNAKHVSREKAYQQITLIDPISLRNLWPKKSKEFNEWRFMRQRRIGSSGCLLLRGRDG